MKRFPQIPWLLSNRLVSNRLVRFLLISVFTLLGGGVVLYEAYKHYWNTTIYQVQTVDFNMLTNLLPTKASQALLQGNMKEIQRTLDSNYGLFGLVVTDKDGQEILAMSNSTFPWSKKLKDQPSSLHNHPYDLLLDPPPLAPQSYYDNYQADLPTPFPDQPDGKVIGRIYYVRGVPPTFLADLNDWVKNLLVDKNAFPMYRIIVLSTVFVTIIFFLGLEIISQRFKDELEDSIRLYNQVENEKKLIRDNLSKVSQERDTLETRIRENQSHHRQVEDELQEKLEIFQKQDVILVQKLSEAQEKEKDATRLLNQVEDENKLIQDNFTKVSQQKDILEREIRENQSHHSQVEDELQENLKKIKEQYYFHEKKLSEAQEKEKDSTRLLNQVEDEKKLIQDNLSKVSQERDTLEAEIRNIQSHRKQLEDEFQEKYEIIQKQKVILEQKLSEAQERSKDASVKIEQSILPITSVNESKIVSSNTGLSDVQIELIARLERCDFTIQNIETQLSKYDPVFKKIADHLGDRYARLSPLYEKLKRTVEKEKGKRHFNFHIPPKFTSQEIKDCMNFLNIFHDNGFGNKPRENGQSIHITLSDNNYLKNFLTGGWLELYVSRNVSRFCNQNRKRFDQFKTLKFIAPDGVEGEFDLISLIDEKLILVECKTGQFELSLDKYSYLSSILKLPQHQMIFVVPHQSKERRTRLSEIHQMTFANLDDLDDILTVATS